MGGRGGRGKFADAWAWTHLDSCLAVELQVAKHGGLGAGEGEVRQRHGDGNVDADVAALDFELELAGGGACTSVSGAGTAWGVIARDGGGSTGQRAARRYLSW